MADIQDLKKKRSTIKGRLTRIANFVEEFREGGNVHELEVRSPLVETLNNEFEAIQDQIEITKADDEEIAYRDSFERTYLKVLADIRKLLNEHKITQAGPSQPPALLTNQNIKINLPPLNLPKFTGQYSEYLTFFDSFNKIIHENDSLSNVDKFHYLKSCLSGEAIKALESLTITNVNYHLALEILHRRFKNTRLIVQEHINNILSSPPLVKNSHVSIRKLLDDITVNLAALRSLQVDTQSWDPIIVPLITTKFDFYNKREWEATLSAEIPKLSELITFLERKFHILESLNASNANTLQTQHKTTNNKQRINSYVTVNNQGCLICKSIEHKAVFKCPEFLGLSIVERIKRIKNLQLCFKCLNKANHAPRNCRIGSCLKCHQPHNVLLHKDDDLKIQASISTPEIPLAPEPGVTTNLLSNLTRSQVLLSTAMIAVTNNVGHKYNMRCLLDSASQSCFITESAYKQLNLPSQKMDFIVSSINKGNTTVGKSVTIKILSNNSPFQMTITCLIVEQIANNLPTFPINNFNVSIPKNIKLADVRFNVPGEIQILLGAEVFWKVLCDGKLEFGENSPSIQKTQLGWVVGGAFNPMHEARPIRSFTTACISLTSLDTQVQKFWEIEQTESKTCLSQEELKCENHFKSNVSRDHEGRFVVKLPFKQEPPHLGSSKQAALNRFLSLETKFEKQPLLKQEYTKIIHEYIKLGHLKLVPTENLNDEMSFYLPHHAIKKEHSQSTKTRIVFDASAKSTNNISLNETLHTGPILQQDIFSIVCRFRVYQFVISADVTQMYRQIWLDPSHWGYQRILWRDDRSDPIKVYNLTTVTFGIASSPYLAMRCFKQLAEENRSTYPIASEVITSGFYIDDLLSGRNTIEEALDLRNKLILIFNQAKFNLCKWTANDRQLLEGLSEVLSDKSIINLDPTIDNKTLGLIWNGHEDLLKYRIKHFFINKITKRTILSIIAQIFDILGLLAPIIITAKILLQKVWSLKIDWDELIVHDVANKFKRFIIEIQELNNLEIPRKVVPIYPFKTAEIHVFSDASEQAYGCCIYLRITDHSNQYYINLMCAKSRVAPLKTITIPRLELCAALQAAQLADKICKNLDLTINRRYFWCDSTIVLSWLAASSNTWKIFVSNRINEIQSLTQVEEWYHVSTKDNPADLVSRGMSPNELIHSKLRFEGPAFLHHDISHINPFSNRINAENLAEKRIVSLITTKSDLDSTIMSEFSSFLKLQRITAIMLRFINKCQRATHKSNYLSINLTREELKCARTKLLLVVQIQNYADEIKALKRGTVIAHTSDLLSLNPFVSEDGLLRVGGRLSNANISFDKKYPIIIPPKHPLTQIIIQEEHKLLLHAGVQTTLYSLRQYYWIPKGRSTIKRILHKCITCFKNKPGHNQPMMGNLPTERTEPLRPFTNCGVDYGGPILIKQGGSRSKKTVKAYICLFICFSTKAIHLELVGDLTSQSFLNCLKRVIARRGHIKNMYSDNATNFGGAKNELKDLHAFLNSTDFNDHVINSITTHHSISWHFIPPRAPNFGGIWERGIRSVKHHIKRTIGNNVLTFEEFYTLLTGIEAILNSRPLTPLSDDPNDLLPLTPAHFLIGEPLITVAEPNYTSVKQNRLSRYQLIQQMRQHFWNRWHAEYLTTLQQRPKWKTPTPNLEKGAMVLIKDDNLAALQWKMGRIVETFPGKDGVVRVVTVKTVNGVILKRPANKLCVLPIEQ